MAELPALLAWVGVAVGETVGVGEAVVVATGALGTLGAVGAALGLPLHPASSSNPQATAGRAVRSWGIGFLRVGWSRGVRRST
ncbi:hypothetical protein CGZ94_09110 [Enemella evansiae]|uniref:Uncharacterized protein n=1 Tax=Enemella evansiae TaxID=2016499 RepID=A0A255GH11_9ACTN|nr:hypothetical protein CGZ94_09110 [Enemella evansiae]